MNASALAQTNIATFVLDAGWSPFRADHFGADDAKELDPGMLMAIRELVLNGLT